MEYTSRHTFTESANQVNKVFWTFQSLEDHPHAYSSAFVQGFLQIVRKE